MKMKNETLVQSLETSDEIVNAILEITDNSRSFESIWEDPTDSEFRTVIARADELAKHSEPELFWGSSTIIVHLDENPVDFSARFDF